VRLALLIVALSSLPALAFAQSSRVGIVGVGADATTVGAVQYRLERALAAKGVRSVPAAESALRLAVGTPPPVPMAMAQDNAKTAAEHAGALLALAPQWQPDLDGFRPSLLRWNRRSRTPA